MEHLFANTDATVLASFKASPVEVRGVCVTAKSSRSDAGLKVTIHLCRAEDDGDNFQVRKSYNLRQLQEIAAQPPRVGTGEWRQVELRFGGASSGRVDSKTGFATETSGDFMLMTALLVQLQRQQQGTSPVLRGVTIEEVDRWWADNAEQVVEAAGDAAQELLQPLLPLASMDSGRREAAVTQVLVSAKEESDLEELLDIFATGIGDVDQFQDRLHDELTALEAANVHAIIAHAPMVDGVIFQLKKTQSLLDDLDESLQVFDFKLRHMREDISAIEACNNLLELQSRNNYKLLATLNDLMDSLALDTATRRTLDNPAISPDRLGPVAAAGWALHAKLQKLQPGSSAAMSHHLLSLRVVREARQELDATTTRFVSRLGSYLCGVISGIVDEMVAEVGRLADRASKLRAPNRKRFRRVCKEHQELIQVLKALDPNSMHKLQSTYTQSMSTLIRKELRICTSELRKSAQLDMADSTVDYNLVKDKTPAAVAPSGRRDRGRTGSDGTGSDTFSEHGLEAGDGRGQPSLATKSKLMQHRRTGSNVPDAAAGAALPLHDAFRLLLDTWLPALLDEAEFAAGVLLLVGRSAPAGPGRAALPRSATDPAASQELKGMVEALLMGLEADFAVLVDLTSKSNQVSCVPMLVSAKLWLGRLAPLGCVGMVLGRPLSSCHDRLRANFSAYVAAQVAAVEGYANKKGITSLALKSTHTLPFISQFALLAHDLELMLSEASEEPDDAAAAGSSSERERARRSTDEFVSPEAEAIAQVRSELNAVYGQLVTTMFYSTDRLAASDAKYGERLRLENYAYFAESVRPLLRHVPALGPHAKQAEAKRDQAMDAYVAQQLEYGKMSRLLDLSSNIDRLLKVISPPEVAFQKDCSLNDIRSLVRSTMEGVDKKLQSMHERVDRHLGSNPALAVRVWRKLRDHLVARYTRLEEQAQICYPNFQLLPSPEELVELFKTVGGAT